MAHDRSSCSNDVSDGQRLPRRFLSRSFLIAASQIQVCRARQSAWRQRRNSSLADTQGLSPAASEIAGFPVSGWRRLRVAFVPACTWPDSRFSTDRQDCVPVVPQYKAILSWEAARVVATLQNQVIGLGDNHQFCLPCHHGLRCFRQRRAELHTDPMTDSDFQISPLLTAGKG